MRMIIGVAIGAIVAIASALIIAALGDSFYPLPADLDVRDPEQVTAAFTSSPAGVKLMLAFSWFAGSLIGGVTAKLVSQWRGAVWPVAAIMAILSLPIMFAVALPVWMQIMMVVAPVLGGVVANHILPVRLPDAAAEGGDDAEV